jgi:carboxyl-terminal processing protease
MKLRLSFLLALAPLFVLGQKNDSVRIFVDSALNIMQNRSLFAKNLDWKVVRDSAHKLAENASTYIEAAPALKFAFNLLNDKHGWLVINDENYFNPFMFRDNSRINEETRREIVKHNIRTAVIQNQYAYLSVPFFGGQTLKGMNSFAQQLQDSLCKSISASTRGIIVDLRLNGGGNMYPMVVGLSNIIGDGKFTESVNSEGDSDGELLVKNHSVTLLDTMVVQLNKSCGNLQNLPLAILIGPATGSSGEQLAIVLSTRRNSMLIGENTAGYVTGNNGFLLPGTNNGIVLGESYTRDRNGKIYDTDVAPYLKRIGGDNFLDLSKDNKVQAAIEWMKKK